MKREHIGGAAMVQHKAWRGHYYRLGDWVELSEEGKHNHTCPEGRDNNRKARIQAFMQKGSAKTNVL